MAMRPLLLMPEILLFLGGLVVLLSGSFLARDRQWVARVLAAAVLVASAVAAALNLSGPAEMAIEGTFTVDVTTGVARIVADLGVLVVLALASDEIAGSPREGETYALMLFSTAGTLILAGADDLLVLVVGFLLASIPLYGLIGIARTPAGAESAMKTYLLGSLLGILMLLGVTVLYGVTATTSYAVLGDRLADAPAGAVAAGGVGVLAGLMFKAGGVPGHFWVPDAAQGAGGAVAAFLTTIPKVGAVIAAYRLVDVLPDTLAGPLLVGLLAVASMTLGNLAAYWQTDPRRLLGWSTVSQVGYLLVPVAVAGRSDLALPSLLLYLAAYTVTNLSAFALTTAFPDSRNLESYRGMGRANPWLGASLVVALLGPQRPGTQAMPGLPWRCSSTPSPASSTTSAGLPPSTATATVTAVKMPKPATTLRSPPRGSSRHPRQSSPQRSVSDWDSVRDCCGVSSPDRPPPVGAGRADPRPRPLLRPSTPGAARLGASGRSRCAADDEDISYLWVNSGRPSACHASMPPDSSVMRVNPSSRSVGTASVLIRPVRQ